jgi:ADP-glucose pyrophosphorylase
MNIREMLEYHVHKRAQLTIAAYPVGAAILARVRSDRDRAR